MYCKSLKFCNTISNLKPNDSFYIFTDFTFAIHYYNTCTNIKKIKMPTKKVIAE